MEAEMPGKLQGTQLTLEHVLRFLCTPEEFGDPSHFTEQYARINVENPRLFVAPAEKRLLERLILPLRHAKGSFMLGNHLGTVSLCGMVGEMAAILLFDISEVRFNGAFPTPDHQRAMFGSTFEKLGQERRVEILRASNLIDEVMKQAFDSIRTRRRKYLHLWSADHASLAQDAIECFKSAAFVVAKVLGVSFDDGKLILRPQILEYLRKHGVSAEG
jgi:hypothetical protein